MIWQDWVLSIGAFVLFISLFPTILGKDKPALSTSVMTATIIAIFSYVMFSLSLFIAAFANTLISASWALLAYQKYRQKK
ncbi:MAG: hypothetical protein WD988_00250 [Candidatus Curtissbacteria bacterium]